MDTRRSFRNPRVFRLFITLLASLAISGASAFFTLTSSGTVQLYPAADSTIKSSDPSVNYGDKKELSVNGGGSQKVALLRFDVDLPDGTLVQTATLHLTSDGPTADLNVQTYFGRRLDESAVTWDSFNLNKESDAEAVLDANAPNGTLSVQLATFSNTLQPNSLTSSWVIVISDPVATKEKQNFHSKESKTVSARPYLEITYVSRPPGPVVSPSEPAVVDELGGTATLSITLSKPPTAAVTVSMTVSDDKELKIVGSASLQFTASDWNVAQNVTVQGLDDGVEDGPQEEFLVFRPMVSSDPAFNGITPDPHPVTNHVIQVVTLQKTKVVRSGRRLKKKIQAVSSESGKLVFYISPFLQAGLHINKCSGVVTWQPDKHQAGVLAVPIEVKHWNTTMSPRVWNLDLKVRRTRRGNPAGIYVWPEGGNDNLNDGTSASPWGTVTYAAANASPGDTIYVRGGTHHIDVEDQDDMPTKIDARGLPNNRIVITRLPGERVTWTCVDAAFYIPPGSQGITIKGFEMDGEADVNDHWHVLANEWWYGPEWQSGIAGCRKGVEVDGKHVTVEDNVIHNMRQKAVNLEENARYVTVKHNVVYNIAHHSLTGGHGIMRQWNQTFGADDPDDLRFYRWDFYGNLVFAVEQRIYSNRLRHRSYAYLRLDEGKSFLIDMTEDTQMKARVSQNLVLYGGLEAIRLKGTPNVEVENNAVATAAGRVRLVPDGITVDKDTTMTNMTLKGNLVHSYFGEEENKGHAFAMEDTFRPTDFPDKIENNFCSGGGVVYRGPVKGIKDLRASGKIFTNINRNNFKPIRRVKRLAGTNNVGVSVAILKRLFKMARDYSVTVEESGWRHDHIRSVQTIIDNAPASQVDPNWWIAPSVGKKKLGLNAYWFNVTAGSIQQKVCKCDKVELVPDEDYWAELAARKR